MTAMKLVYDLQVRYSVPALTAPSPGTEGVEQPSEYTLSYPRSV